MRQITEWEDERLRLDEQNVKDAREADLALRGAHRTPSPLPNIHILRSSYFHALKILLPTDPPLSSASARHPSVDISEDEHMAPSVIQVDNEYFAVNENDGMSIVVDQEKSQPVAEEEKVIGTAFYCDLARSISVNGSYDRLFLRIIDNLTDEQTTEILERCLDYSLAFNTYL